MIHFRTGTDHAFVLAHDAHSSGRYDKSHALSHIQGGLEGGPNYFKQKRSVNQRRSGAGNLWRDIETYLAANAGVFAFVRLIYRPGETGEMPFEAEYGILNGPDRRQDEGRLDNIIGCHSRQ